MTWFHDRAIMTGAGHRWPFEKWCGGRENDAWIQICCRKENWCHQLGATAAAMRKWIHRKQWKSQKKIIWLIAYILIGPCGGGALSGHAHTGAFLAAASIVTLKIVESQFAAVAIFSLHVFLKEWKKEKGIKFMALKPEAAGTGHVISVLMWCR